MRFQTEIASQARVFPIDGKNASLSDGIKDGNSPSLLSAVVMNEKVFSHFFGGVYLPLFLHEKAPFLYEMGRLCEVLFSM